MQDLGLSYTLVLPFALRVFYHAWRASDQSIMERKDMFSNQEYFQRLHNPQGAAGDSGVSEPMSSSILLISPPAIICAVSSVIDRVNTEDVSV